MKEAKKMKCYRRLSTTIILMRSFTLAGHTMSFHPTNITYPASGSFSLAWPLSIAKPFACLNNPTTGQTCHLKTSQMLKAIYRRETSTRRVHTLYPPTGTMSLQMENEVTKRDHHSSVSTFTLMSSVCIFKLSNSCQIHMYPYFACNNNKNFIPGSFPSQINTLSANTVFLACVLSRTC